MKIAPHSGSDDAYDAGREGPAAGMDAVYMQSASLLDVAYFTHSSLAPPPKQIR